MTGAGATPPLVKSVEFVGPADAAGAAGSANPYHDLAVQRRITVYVLPEGVSLIRPNGEEPKGEDTEHKGEEPEHKGEEPK